ncbi:hypothetical protein [Pontibacter kalidii]|uniref:hypothetical protein n=1 Tax=Pontibacter kalidii TaxID=2592049 RepID=UPI00225947AE|nr:hypothetical protein [Pontibacter kalidii]
MAIGAVPDIPVRNLSAADLQIRVSHTLYLNYTLYFGHILYLLAQLLFLSLARVCN